MVTVYPFDARKWPGTALRYFLKSCVPFNQLDIEHLIPVNLRPATYSVNIRNRILPHPFDGLGNVGNLRRKQAAEGNVVKPD